MLVSFSVEVGNAAYAPVRSHIDPRYHTARPDLSAVGDSIRHMSNKSARLGADLAPLKAETAIDAVRTVGSRALQYAHRSARAHSNSKAAAATNQHIADASHRMRTESITVWIAPGKIRRSGDGQLELHQLVIRFQLRVADGPICSHTVFRVDPEIGGVKAGRE